MRDKARTRGPDLMDGPEPAETEAEAQRERKVRRPRTDIMRGPGPASPGSDVMAGPGVREDVMGGPFEPTDVMDDQEELSPEEHRTEQPRGGSRHGRG